MANNVEEFSRYELFRPLTGRHKLRRIHDPLIGHEYGPSPPHSVDAVSQSGSHIHCAAQDWTHDSLGLDATPRRDVVPDD